MMLCVLRTLRREKHHLGPILLPTWLITQSRHYVPLHHCWAPLSSFLICLFSLPDGAASS